MSSHDEKLMEATRVGIIENLISPEYGDSWVRELISEYAGVEMEDVSEGDIERVDNAIQKRLHLMAQDVLGELVSDEAKSTYTKFKMGD